jgi:hypothetical protein
VDYLLSTLATLPVEAKPMKALGPDLVGTAGTEHVGAEPAQDINFE